MSDALQKISSFHQQKSVVNRSQIILFHRPQDHFLNGSDIPESTIKILAAEQPITGLSLCRYLYTRRIDKSIANRYCREVSFELNQRIYKAIGFKNFAGGYELRNEYFKGSSSPKYISYFTHKNADSIAVFEGFFDFLSLSNHSSH